MWPLRRTASVERVPPRLRAGAAPPGAPRRPPPRRTPGRSGRPGCPAGGTAGRRRPGARGGGWWPSAPPAPPGTGSGRACRLTRKLRPTKRSSAVASSTGSAPAGVCDLRRQAGDQTVPRVDAHRRPAVGPAAWWPPPGGRWPGTSVTPRQLRFVRRDARPPTAGWRRRRTGPASRRGRRRRGPGRHGTAGRGASLGGLPHGSGRRPRTRGTPVTTATRPRRSGAVTRKRGLGAGGRGRWSERRWYTSLIRRAWIRRSVLVSPPRPSRRAGARGPATARSPWTLWPPSQSR